MPESQLLPNSERKTALRPLYPNQWLWFFIRSFFVIGMAVFFIALFFDIHIGTRYPISVREIFWLVAIPLMVLVIYFTPLLWRNICPLATVHLWYFTLFHRRKLEREGISANQLKGFLGKVYQFLRTRGMLVSAVLFWIIVPLRLVFIYESSSATFWLLTITFLSAAVFGFFFPVKSGWCTSICPVNAVEKTYSINPAFYLKNYRCHFSNPQTGRISSCSGCSFNCIDVVEPEHAYWQAASKKLFHDTVNAQMRKLFVATLPAFVFTYFLLTQILSFLPQSIFLQIVMIYAIFFVMMSLSAGVYFGIKRMFYHQVVKKFGEIRIEEPNEYYALLKRRLDLLFITVAMNFFWLLSVYGIVFIVLPAFFHFPAGWGMFFWWLGYFPVGALSMNGLLAGWNETYQAGHHQPSWW